MLTSRFRTSMPGLSNMAETATRGISKAPLPCVGARPRAMASRLDHALRPSRAGALLQRTSKNCLFPFQPRSISVRGEVSNHERRGKLADCPSIPQGERTPFLRFAGFSRFPTRAIEQMGELFEVPCSRFEPASTPAAATAFAAGAAPFALALAARLQLRGLLFALVAQLEVIAPAPGIDVAAGQRGLHGAAGFRLVAAVGQAAT